MRSAESSISPAHLLLRGRSQQSTRPSVAFSLLLHVVAGTKLGTSCVKWVPLASLLLDPRSLKHSYTLGLCGLQCSAFCALLTLASADWVGSSLALISSLIHGRGYHSVPQSSALSQWMACLVFLSASLLLVIWGISGGHSTQTQPAISRMQPLITVLKNIFWYN